MKRYSAQALAIIMIVLVIASIIGLAMFSRVLRENARIVDEKSSAEALEVVDSAIKAVKGTSVSNIKEVCLDSDYGQGVDSPTGCVVKGVSSVNQFFSDLGVQADISSGFANCNNEISTLEMSTRLAGPDDELEIRPDIVRSFVIRGQTPTTPSCSLNIKAENKGGSVSGLMISNIYGKSYSGGVAGEYKPYDYDDILSYCIHSEGGDCSQDSRFSSTWTPIQTGSEINIPLGSSGSSYEPQFVNGIEKFTKDNNLMILPGRFGNVVNPGEFDIICPGGDANCFIEDSRGVHSTPNIRSGVAVEDYVSGAGYIMYSSQNVHTRFTSNPPYTDNAQNYIAVRHNGTSWQYNNNTIWVNFTPVSTDVLVAEVTFATLTTNKTLKATYENGIEKFTYDNNLTFVPNQWGGVANAGEFDITCPDGDANCFIQDSKGTHSTPNIVSGVAAQDGASGSGYIMYSAQRVHTRFSSSVPHADNAHNYIAVRYSGGSWQYDNNNVWVNFTPVSTDTLVATVNFTSDTVTNTKVPPTPTSSGAYTLDEVRLRAVGGIVSIKASLSDTNCIKDWEMIKMVVGANCTGSYRAKEIQIPQQDWALPIFDYVVYNGMGILQSE